MALKQQRRWLLKSILKRQLKSVFTQVQTSSRLFHLVQCVKLGEFVWSWILKGCIKVQEKQKRGRFLVFTSCTKREIIILKQFHVVVVKRRQGNVQKKRDASAKMLLSLLNLLFFKTFSLPSNFCEICVFFQRSAKIKFPQIKITYTAYIFPAKIYSRVNIL